MRCDKGQRSKNRAEHDLDWTKGPLSSNSDADQGLQRVVGKAEHTGKNNHRAPESSCVGPDGGHVKDRGWHNRNQCKPKQST